MYTSKAKILIFLSSLLHQRAHDYAPDVANAKRQASQQLKHVENTHAEFLKKLHKVCMHTYTHTHTNSNCRNRGIIN